MVKSRENGPEIGPEVSNLEKEREKKFVLYIDLMRHSNRFAGEGKWKDSQTGEELSWNDTTNLTPEGKRAAQEYGAGLPTVDFVVSVASSEPRAAETGMDVEKGSGRARTLGPNQFRGITYSEMGEGGKKAVKKCKPLIEAKAAEFADYGRLSPEVRAKVRQGAQEVGLREALKDEKFLNEAAQGMGYSLWALREMFKAAQGASGPGFKTAMPLVNHGGFNESLLLKVLKIRDKATGEERAPKDVDELGGFFAPAESFRIKLVNKDGLDEYDYEFTNPERQKKFAGMELSIDWDAVRELARGYEDRIRPGKKHKVE